MKTVILFILGQVDTTATTEQLEALVAASIMKESGRVPVPLEGGRFGTESYNNVIIVVGEEPVNEVPGTTVYNVTEDLLPTYKKTTTTLLSLATFVAGATGWSADERKALSGNEAFTKTWLREGVTTADLITLLLTETTFVAIDQDFFGVTEETTKALISGMDADLKILPDTTFGFVKTEAPVTSLSIAKKIATENNTVVVTKMRGFGDTKTVVILPGNKTFQDWVAGASRLTPEVVQGVTVLTGEITEDFAGDVQSVILGTKAAQKTITNVTTPPEFLERFTVSENTQFEEVS